jgi:hypothetical protein
VKYYDQISQERYKSMTLKCSCVNNQRFSCSEICSRQPKSSQIRSPTDMFAASLSSALRCALVGARAHPHPHPAGSRAAPLPGQRSSSLVTRPGGSQAASCRHVHGQPELELRRGSLHAVASTRVAGGRGPPALLPQRVAEGRAPSASSCSCAVGGRASSAPNLESVGRESSDGGERE